MLWESSALPKSRTKGSIGPNQIKVHKIASRQLQGFNIRNAR